MLKRTNILGLIFVCALFACQQKNVNEDDTILARVYDKYLYESDIKEIVPANISAKDSLALVKSYINNWIRQKLLVKQAEVNLTEAQKDFSKQLEKYENDLITYKYETLLLQQNLDTVVEDHEIERYYNTNKENFQLKSNIVKVKYVKVDRDSEYKSIFKNLLKAYKKEQTQSISDSLLRLCQLYATDFILDDSQWIYFDNLLKRIPITTYNQEAYLKENTFIEFVEDSYQYYVSFLDFNIKDKYSPIDFEKNNIRQLIVNIRKTELLNRMRKEIFDQALEKKEIEIY